MSVVVASSVSVPDAVTFVACAILAVAGGLTVVGARHPVHAALGLVLSLFAVAVLFLAEQADFLAAVQVIVYAGAIVVLFLFVIMLLGVDRAEKLAEEPLALQRIVAVLVGLGILGLVVRLGWGQWATGPVAQTGAAHGGEAGVTDLARTIFTTYLLPFEATAALLVIAVVGAIVLVRRSMKAERDEVGGGGAGEDGDDGDATGELTDEPVETRR